MRPLLIGQAPGPNTRADLQLFPLPVTSTGGRLQALMGLTKAAYIKLFDRINLLNEFPGRNKCADKFPLLAAKLAARSILPLLKDRTVILVGRAVADAFLVDQPFHEWVKIPTLTWDRGPCEAHVAVVPHPSGRNRWYGKPENRLVAEAFWQDLIKNLA